MVVTTTSDPGELRSRCATSAQRAKVHCRPPHWYRTRRPKTKKKNLEHLVTMVVVVVDVGVVVVVLVMMTLAKITATTSTVTKANRNSQSKTDDENHGLQRR